MTTLGFAFGSLLGGQNVKVLPKLDCVLQDAWNKFKLNGAEADLDIITIETAIRNYLSEKPKITLAVELKVQLLLFLTRLMDGERHYLFQYNPSPTAVSSSSTVLESAFRIFRRLVQTFPERKKNLEALQLKILQQNAWEELKMVVESEDTNHPVLIENSYQKFCKLIGKELERFVLSLELQECAQGCAVHRRSIRYRGEHKKSNEKFEKEMLSKLLHMNIESWLPKEHMAMLEKEFLKPERLGDYDEENIAHHIRKTLYQMNLIQELPVDQTLEH